MMAYSDAYLDEVRSELVTPYLDQVINRNTMMNGEKYFVQCMCGFVGVARAESALEDACAAREAAGYLDALCLHGADQCPACREREESEWNFYALEVRPFEERGERCYEAPWELRARLRLERDEKLAAMKGEGVEMEIADRLSFEAAVEHFDADRMEL